MICSLKYHSLLLAGGMTIGILLGAILMLVLVDWAKR